MSLSLFSEPYAPTGNLGDSGIRKLLGTPSLDLLQTVVRESVQNSCDAAKLDRGVDIRFRLRTLTSEQMNCLVDEVLADRPRDHDDTDSSSLALPAPDAAPISVLEIIDIGTTGLAGPVRADRIPQNIQYTDFIDFFRNVGTARNTESGGGTYGFGKIALYLASTCSTILVDTLTEFHGQPVRRFMGCRLGPSHEVVDTDGYRCRFTGRHWWGKRSPGDPVVDPLDGSEAAELAARLGMPERDASATGTTIMILSPRFDGEETADRIVEQLLWQFWPRLTRDTPAAQQMHPCVEFEGVRKKVPAPEQYPPLNLYARALSLIREGRSEAQQIHGSKNRLLGRCATVKGVFSPRLRVKTANQRSHAIALMRPVGLVVRYLEGPAIPDAQFEWAGVFVADSDPETESAFAGSEPPAHDEWQPKILTSSAERSMVRTALRKVRDIANSMVDDIEPFTTGAVVHGESVAAVSQVLGSLLRDDGDAMPVRTPRQRGPGRRRVTASASRPRFAKIGIDERGSFAEFEVDVVTGGQPCFLDIAAWPVLDGAFARMLPNGDSPNVQTVTSGEGVAIENDNEIYKIRPRIIQTIRVRTTLPDLMAVGIEVTLTEEVSES